MAKKYTHLFFDLDNTIWDFDSNSFDALQEALKNNDLIEKLGPFDEFYKIFDGVNERLWALYREGKMSKKILRIQRFEESFEKNGTPLPGMGEMVNDAYMAEMPGLTRLVEGARELLDYLHGKYEMAIITNGFKEVQYQKIVRSGLSKYFKKIFVSEEIGAQKPKQAIFEHAIKSMNARKRSSLMIGDSWEADIEGARKFGIDQIYYSPRFDPGISASEVQPDTMDEISASRIIVHKQSNTKTSTSIVSSLLDLFEIL